MEKLKVYQFYINGRWIDYRGWMWNAIPPNERRVIYRDVNAADDSI